MHTCEPSLETLKKIRAELYTQPSTDENVKKIAAIESQITRVSAETGKLTSEIRSDS